MNEKNKKIRVIATISYEGDFIKTKKHSREEIAVECVKMLANLNNFKVYDNTIRVEEVEE